MLQCSKSCLRTLQGTNCDVDVNECVIYQGTAQGCHSGATCHNTNGGFRWVFRSYPLSLAYFSNESCQLSEELNNYLTQLIIIKMFNWWHLHSVAMVTECFNCFHLSSHAFYVSFTLSWYFTNIISLFSELN